MDDLSDFEDIGNLEEQLPIPFSPDHDQDEDVYQLTAVDDFPALAEDVVLLRKAWVGEVCAPELLVFQEAIIEKMISQLKDMQSILDEYRSEGTEQMYTASLYQMELDRIRFAVAKYLRVRIKKIERDVFFILVNAKEMLAQNRLCDREFNYAREYCDLLHGHLKSTVLDHLPEKYTGIDHEVGSDKMIAEPDLDIFVIGRVSRDIGSIEISDDQDTQLDLRLGDEYMVRYRPIRKLVLDGSIELI